MLGWTNDGFVGVRSLDLSTVSGSLTVNLLAYDAGSETNNEANGFLNALGLGNARDLENGVITNHSVNNSITIIRKVIRQRSRKLTTLVG
jgi:hypothetical protein